MTYQLYRVDFQDGIKIPVVLGTCKQCEGIFEHLDDALNTVQELFGTTKKLAQSEPALSFAILNESQVDVIQQFADSFYSDISEMVVEACALYTKVLFSQMNKGKNFQQAHDIAAMTFSAASAV